MKKFRVNLVRIDHLSIEVEADDEDAALEEAYQEAPGICAHCSGWGRDWSVEDGQWMSLEEFHGADYSADAYGAVVEEIDGAS